MKSNRKSFVVVLLIIISISFFKYTDFKQRNEENPYPIGWDVFGYYLYLPATFVYHDLGLEDHSWQEHIRNKYKPSTTAYQVAPGVDNKQVIIYNIGYAIIDAPGFFAAHLLASDSEKDGFSKPYQLALQFTAFLLTLVGLFLFRKISLHFFSDTITALLLIISLIGTNYFFQVTYDGVMPHNILFTLNCFIIWFTIRWHESRKTKHLVLLALFLGLATICRPTELIWILLPAFWGVYDKASFVEKWAYLKSHFKGVSTFLLVLISILFIQFIYLKFATGSFLAVNHHSERFSFFDPYTIKFLFSYRKGWLVYTPVMILGIIGFYFLYKKNKFIWLPLFSFFLINLYVVSSWECWWYGASFSQRPMVETYAMMSIPLGYFLSWVIDGSQKMLKIALLVLIPLLIVLNLFQTWQFLKDIISLDRMTAAYYWKVFGKTSVDPEATKLLSVDRGQSVFTDYNNYLDKYERKEMFHLDFEQPLNSNHDKYIVDTTAKQGKRSFVLKDDMAFSNTFECTYSETTSKSYLWIRATLWVYLTVPYTESNSCIVILAESKGRVIQYLTTNYQNFNVPLFTWTQIHLDFLTPEPRHRDDKIKSYFWNMGTKPVLIDDYKIEFFEPVDDPR